MTILYEKKSKTILYENDEKNYQPLDQKRWSRLKSHI